MTNFNAVLSNLSTKDLVSLYNNLTGKSISKFSNRATGEARTMEAVEADIDLATEICVGLGYMEAPVAPAEKEAAAAEKAAKAEAKKPKLAYPEALEKGGCPHCGDCDNGLTYDEPGDDYQGPWVFCHMCNTPFHNKTGAVRPAKREKSTSPRPAMPADRRITCETTGEEFVNAHQMWKANPTWMTSGQQDRLTKVLFDGVRAGTPVSITINGRTFYVTAHPVVAAEQTEG